MVQRNCTCTHIAGAIDNGEDLCVAHFKVGRAFGTGKDAHAGFDLPQLPWTSTIQPETLGETAEKRYGPKRKGVKKMNIGLGTKDVQLKRKRREREQRMKRRKK